MKVWGIYRTEAPISIEFCGVSAGKKEFMVDHLLADIGIGVVLPILSSPLATGVPVLPCTGTAGNFIDRHHVEPRVKLYVRRDESFLFPLKYIDLARTTHTSLDVMLEKYIDDYRNIDGDRDMSGTWTGFTRFTVLDEKPPDGYTWSSGRLTRKQTTFGPDTLWPEIRKDMSDALKRQEKQKWAIEKPKLDNAGM